MTVPAGCEGLAGRIAALEAAVFRPAPSVGVSEVTEAMVRQALHFCPDSVQGQPARWRWIAAHINAALESAERQQGEGE